MATGYESEEMFTGGEETETSEDEDSKDKIFGLRKNLACDTPSRGIGSSNFYGRQTQSAGASNVRRSQSRQKTIPEKNPSFTSPRVTQRLRQTTKNSPPITPHIPLDQHSRRSRTLEENSHTSRITPAGKRSRHNITHEENLPTQSSVVPTDTHSRQSMNPTFPIESQTEFRDATPSLETPSNVTNVLGELTNTLKQIVTRLDKQESRLASMEKQLVSSATSCSSSGDSKKQTKVPLAVRSEVRRMYKALCDEDTNFIGFDTEKGVCFNDPQNLIVVNRLIKEVNASNPSFQAGLIRSASYTYYRTLCQEESLKKRGKLDDRNRTRRRKERSIRKVRDRTSALNKSTLNEKSKRKWMTVITPEFMSDEESGSDDGGSLFKKELAWRSCKVSDFFNELDAFTDDSKSIVAKRQTRQRVLDGGVSTRSIPSGKQILIPNWALAQPRP